MLGPTRFARMPRAMSPSAKERAGGIRLNSPRAHLGGIWTARRGNPGSGTSTVDGRVIRKSAESPGGRPESRRIVHRDARRWPPRLDQFGRRTPMATQTLPTGEPRRARNARPPPRARDGGGIARGAGGADGGGTRPPSEGRIARTGHRRSRIAFPPAAFRPGGNGRLGWLRQFRIRSGSDSGRRSPRTGGGTRPSPIHQGSRRAGLRGGRSSRSPAPPPAPRRPGRAA